MPIWGAKAISESFRMSPPEGFGALLSVLVKANIFVVQPFKGVVDLKGPTESNKFTSDGRCLCEHGCGDLRLGECVIRNGRQEICMNDLRVSN